MAYENHILNYSIRIKLGSKINRKTKAVIKIVGSVTYNQERREYWEINPPNLVQTGSIAERNEYANRQADKRKDGRDGPVMVFNRIYAKTY